MPTTPPAPAPIAQEWFTADELAARLRVNRRTILNWVAVNRIPKPTKFGKAARWSAAVVAQLEATGVDRPLDQGNAFERLPPSGVKVACPCCGAEILVKRDGTAEEVKPAATAKRSAKTAKKAK